MLNVVDELIPEGLWIRINRKLKSTVELSDIFILGAVPAHIRSDVSTIHLNKLRRCDRRSLVYPTPRLLVRLYCTDSISLFTWSGPAGTMPEGLSDLIE